VLGADFATADLATGVLAAGTGGLATAGLPPGGGLTAPTGLAAAGLPGGGLTAPAGFLTVVGGGTILKSGWRCGVFDNRFWVLGCVYESDIVGRSVITLWCFRSGFWKRNVEGFLFPQTWLDLVADPGLARSLLWLKLCRVMSLLTRLCLTPDLRT